MKLHYSIINAFTDRPFKGNPAAVFLLERPLEDNILQLIASELNLSQTAFVLKQNEHYSIRWFGPKREVIICGHATLASTFALAKYLSLQENHTHKNYSFCFQSLSGPLFSTFDKESGLITLDFPEIKYHNYENGFEELKTLGLDGVLECYQTNENKIFALIPEDIDLKLISISREKLLLLKYRALCVTQKREKLSFAYRYFAPLIGIDEDPVCGSSQCFLTPFWLKQFYLVSENEINPVTLKALAESERGGELSLQYKDRRVYISGKAFLAQEGDFFI